MKIVKGKDAFNSNPHITEYHIPVHSDAWYLFRTTGIPGLDCEATFGASEIGTILGLSDYRPVLPELMQYKDGSLEPMKNVTEASLSGILAESSILERWQYWDGTETGYLKNWQNRDIKRKYKNVNCYMVNDKYPWLFCSLDAAIEKGQYSMGGQKLTYDSPIECKKISYFIAKKWEHGIPPSHIAQVQTQMLITDTDWAELAILSEGPFGPVFDVVPVERKNDFCDAILERTERLYKRVKELREKRQEIELAKHKNSGSVDKLLTEYENLLPLPDASEAYKDYYAERFLKETEKFEGNMGDFKAVKRRMRITAAIKELSRQQQLEENKILHRFTKEKGEYMTFEGNGRVRYYTQKGKSKPQLDFRGIDIVIPEIKIKI